MGTGKKIVKVWSVVVAEAVVAVAVVSNYLKYLSILSEVSKIGKPDFFPMSQKIILNTLILFAIMLDCC